jgi:hypothetical protein
LILVVFTAACEHPEKTEPAARAGSATASAPSRVAPSAASPDARAEPSGAAAGSGSAAAGSGSAAAGSGSAAAGSGTAALCEDYYRGELKLAHEERWRLVEKHDAFIADCAKLPAELQSCQGDLRYALDNDDACSRLIRKHADKLRALRRLVARS